tara:strand:- start:371 stop:2125 length:1755 start_codon:yes stop_codon:yes gene_type:complete
LKNFIKKISLILQGNKNKIILVGLLMLFAMLIEIVGLLLLVSFVDLILNNSFKSDSIENLFSFFYTSSIDTHLILVFSSFLTFFYLCKFIFMYLNIKIQTKFVFNLLESLSSRIYKNYLNRPYNFFTNINSSYLIRNIINETGNVTGGLIKSLIILCGEVIIILSLSIFIMFKEPLSFFTTLPIVILILILFYKYSRTKIYNFGKERQKSDALRIKTVTQSLNDIKQIKISNNYNQFVSMYKNYTTHMGNQYVGYETLNTIPKYFLEFIAVLCISLVISTALVFQSTNQDELISTMALFAAAAFRIMPSINRIIVSTNSIRFHLPSLEVFYKVLSEIQETSEEKIDEPTYDDRIDFKQLNLKNISFYYKDQNSLILNNINLQINKNSITGIIGKTGSGKSTLIDILTGLQKPQIGSIFLNDKKLDQNIINFQRSIGYVSQEITLFDDSIKKNIAFLLNDKLIDNDKIERATRLANINEFLNDLPEGLDTIVGEKGIQLSGGQRQRIGIARALYNNPKILILDESTNSLDKITESSILQELRLLKKELTIIFITHKLGILKYCDDTYMLKNKKLNHIKDLNSVEY